MANLSKKSTRILAQIAKGKTYDQILAADNTLTYLDIFAAAAEAVGEPRATKGSGGVGGLPPEKLKEIRAKYPRAYEPWTQEEDLRLGGMLGQGKSADEMAAVLQRNTKAIISRLDKLGLIGGDRPSSTS